MKAEIESRCATRLRELRRRRGYTLEEFERVSNGEVKAVVLGSYERGSRAISLARLERLAELYEVPIDYFFSGKNMESDFEKARFIFDLRRVRISTTSDESILAVKRLLSTVARKRSDWNGEVLTIRAGDAQLLALISSLELEELAQKLRLAGLLFASEVNGQRSL